MTKTPHVLALVSIVTGCAASLDGDVERDELEVTEIAARDPGASPPARIDPLAHCLKQTIDVSPAGVVHAQFSRRAPAAATTFDLRASTFLANEIGPYTAQPGVELPGVLPAAKCIPDEPVAEAPGVEKYPTVFGGALPLVEDLCVLGGTMIGEQHRDLPWRLVKRAYDGDAIRIEGAGRINVLGSWVDNVEDAISPRGTGHFHISHVYARAVRDDFVENDGLMSGVIEDVLVDGTLVFLSARPGADSTTTRTPPVVEIRNALVHINPQRWDTDMNGNPGRGATCVDALASGCGGVAERCVGTAPGNLFKWSPNAGKVFVRDSTFLVDRSSVNGPSAMQLPDGTYENVTIVWLGDGAYPALPLPAGVELVTDIDVWTERRAAWLERHGCDAAGDHCTRLVQ